MSFQENVKGDWCFVVDGQLSLKIKLPNSQRLIAVSPEQGSICPTLNNFCDAKIWYLILKGVFKILNQYLAPWTKRKRIEGLGPHSG